MTTTKEATDKWFTVYVPPSTGGTESYLRIGSPDTKTEASFLSTLRTTYQDAPAAPAVAAAFNQSSTAGMVVYTTGDLVQFVNGTYDTRVLNDRFVVHVLNRDTVAAQANSYATGGDSTYRTYLRLGKPYDTIEGAFQGVAADADLAELVKSLAPPAPASPISATDAASNYQNALSGADADKVAARLFLSTAAEAGDRTAIDKIDDLLHNGATDAVKRQEAQIWARNTLQALHLKFANKRKNEALLNTGEGRAKLADHAKNKNDPVARRKLIEIYEQSFAGLLAASGTISGMSSQVTVDMANDAQSWAKGVLDTLPKMSKEHIARWSLGDGVALYSDRPITLTTPDKLAITVGAHSRTVFGPQYAEIYDVSDDVIGQIKDGTIATLDQIAEKKLITANLVRRDLMGTSWRTTSFDQSKALGYKFSDYGSFELSSSYAFAAGFKFTNGVAASFDGSVGISTAVSTAFKVEAGDSRLSTSFPHGSIEYDTKKDIKGNEIALSVNAVENVVNAATSEVYAKAARVVLGILNAATLAYTAAAVGVGNKKSGLGDSETSGVRDFLQAGEKVYLAATVINAAMLAAGVIVGVVQLVSRKTAALAGDHLPVQLPNVKLNSGGVKIQAGPSYINVDPSGIQIYGPQVVVAGPFTNVLPQFLTGDLTTTEVVAQSDMATAIAELMAIEI